MLAGSTLSLAASADAWAAGPAYAQQGAPTGGNDAFFGYSVAVDGSTAVVGAMNGNGTLGAAYVYVRSGTTWSLQQELTAADGAANDQFGYAVAVSGNTALVAAAGKDSGQGYVYAFSRSGTTWTLQQEFTASDGAANDCFGCSLGLGSSTAVVGAPGHLGGTGAAYVLTSSGTWQKQQEFLGTATTSSFGFAVAASSDGTTVVVGDFGVASQKGSVYVYSLNGTWSQTPVEATLAAADGAANDRFGYAVGAIAGTVIVGAYGNGGTGAAYVFSGSGTAWSQQAKLLASDRASGDSFGESVALSGNTAVVGAYEKAGTNGPGAAYVFTETSGTWVQSEVFATAPGQYFGYAVAASGTTAVVGAYGASNDNGAAYFFAPSAVGAPGMQTWAVFGLAAFLLGVGLAVGRRRGVGSHMKTQTAIPLSLALAIATGVLGCSSSPEQSRDGDQGSANASGNEPTGTVRAQLVLPSGQDIEVLNWDLTGPGGLSTVIQSGKVDSQGLNVSFLVGGIPAGSGYAITLSGTATDGSVTCTGSAPFAVVARMTTDVTLELACSVSTTGAHVTLVNGTTFNCAGTSGIAASPTETTVGHSVSLSGLASGPVPASLTYKWSASTGTFSQPTAASTQFQCTNAGAVTVSLVVGDGPVPAGQSCSPTIDTATAVVTCDAVQPPPPDAGASDGGAPEGGAPDAGVPEGGASPVPAMPPVGVGAMGFAMMALGSLFAARRRKGRRS
jgi:hypothetical protein